MKRFLLATLALLFAVPANAADEKTLECVYQELDASTRQLIDDSVVVLMRTPPGGKIERPSAAEDEGVQRAARTCMARYGWSEGAADGAAKYARAKASGAGAARVLKEYGIDAAPLAALYYELPLDVRQTPMNDPSVRDAISEMAVKGLDRKLFPPEQARRVGRYMGGLNLQDIGRAEFLRN